MHCHTGPYTTSRLEQWTLTQDGPLDTITSSSTQRNTPMQAAWSVVEWEWLRDRMHVLHVFVCVHWYFLHKEVCMTILFGILASIRLCAIPFYIVTSTTRCLGFTRRTFVSFFGSPPLLTRTPPIFKWQRAMVILSGLQVTSWKWLCMSCAVQYLQKRL